MLCRTVFSLTALLLPCVEQGAVGRRFGIHFATDGNNYAGASFRNAPGAEVGGSITVVYASLNPQMNLPQSGFRFYDFK